MVFLGKEWAGYLYFWANLIFGFFYFLFFIIYVHIYNTINFLGSFQKSSIFFFLSFSRRVLKLRANYICFKYKFYIVRGQIQKFEGKRGWGESKKIMIEIKEISCCKWNFSKAKGLWSPGPPSFASDWATRLLAKRVIIDGPAWLFSYKSLDEFNSLWAIVLAEIIL